MRQIVIIFEFQTINILKINPFKDMIRKYGNYAFVTSGSCVIWTDSTSVQVRDFLLSGLGNGDKLFVAEISAPAAWSTTISKDVAEYVIKNLKDI
jgi:hypothetical protein